MEIAPLGQLTRDRDIEEWLVSQPIEVPLLGSAKLSFTLTDFEDDPNPDDFVEAINNFLAMTEADKTKAAPYVYQHYVNFVELVGVGVLTFDIDNANNVWKFLHLSGIYVSRRPYGDQEVHVQVTGNCDWDSEHGIQIVFRKGNILRRVSDQDGHLAYCDAYDVPEEEDRIC